jgi:hypothetical protein
MQLKLVHPYVNELAISDDSLLFRFYGNGKSNDKYSKYINDVIVEI